MSMFFNCFGRIYGDASCNSSYYGKARSWPRSATVNIEGAGFASSSQISITFDTVAAGTVPTDDRGAWASLVTVPDTTLGQHLFTATDADGNSASAPFRVEPAAPRRSLVSGRTAPARGLFVIDETNLSGASAVTSVPLRWVLVRDPLGKFDLQALLCTD